MTRRFQAPPGMFITDAAVEAVKLSAEHNETIEFVFNGATVIVVPGMRPREVTQKWSEKTCRPIHQEFGK